jgi:RNA polymerase sigma-70 factor, ECF subfamily
MPGTLNSSRIKPAGQETAPVTDSWGQRTTRFEREVLPHLDRVYCAALCLAEDQAEAGELVQETFARAYAEFCPTSPGSNVTAWLYRILVSTHARSRRKRREPPPPARGTRSRAGRPGRSGVSPAQISAVLRLPGPVVRDALRQLQPDSRLVVYLADVEGLACREIAGIMTVPVETVARRLHHGRRQLRELLRDHAATRPDHDGAGAAEMCLTGSGVLRRDCRSSPS